MGEWVTLCLQGEDPLCQPDPQEGQTLTTQTEPLSSPPTQDVRSSGSIPTVSVGIPDLSRSGPAKLTLVTLRQLNPLAPACGPPRREVVELPGHRLCRSFHRAWQFDAAVSCQTA